MDLCSFFCVKEGKELAMKTCLFLKHITSSKRSHNQLLISKALVKMFMNVLEESTIEEWKIICDLSCMLWALLYYNSKVKRIFVELKFDHVINNLQKKLRHGKIIF